MIGRGQRRADSGAGFSLIEILVVLGIVGLLLGLAVPRLTDVVGGSSLTQAADLVRGEVNSARQLAATSNRVVLVRFFEYADPMVPGGERRFRAVQVGYAEDPEADGGPRVAAGDVFVPAGKLRRFPEGVVALTGGTYSTLLSDPPLRARSVEMALPGGKAGEGLPATAVALRVFPDGSSDLDASASEAWCVTLVGERDAEVGGGSLPGDFVTLQVDPYTMQLREYRRR